MASVAVLGANGQLGSDVCATFAERGWSVVPLVHADLDLATAQTGAMAAVLRGRGADVVVNSAAYADVPGCETDPARAYAVNAAGVRSLARACGETGARLIHISTDYVFDGAKRTPYVESDLPCPVQVYGNSKLAGEYFARTETGRHAVVRSAGLYGTAPCRSKSGANFVQRMLTLAREKGVVTVVHDEIGTPTWTGDLAAQLERIAAAGATGLFHATAQGEVSWHDFAAAIFELTGTAVRLERTTTATFPSPVRRPAYSVLENAGLKALGLDIMPGWRAGLERYLKACGSLSA